MLLKFCQQQLGVGSKSPAPALLGECGQHNLFIYCYMRCIKYWVKLVKLNTTCLLKSSYDMLYRQCNAGRDNWASNIKNILYRFGDGHIWEMQYIGDESKFLSEFKRRLLDCNMQEWHESMSEMSKLRSLCLYKTEFGTEPYLFLYIPQRLRSSLAKLRIGSHDLEIECGRHQNIPVKERLCKLCYSLNRICIEDEHHVLLQCPFYDELRDLYLNLGNEPKTVYTFVKLMSMQNDQLINLASFAANMFKLRRALMSQLRAI